MSTLTRNDFLQQTAGRSIDLSEARPDSALSGVDLDRADLNHDGKLSGRRELRQAFHEVDRFDHDGHYGSILAKTAGGAPTRAGAAAAALIAHAESPAAEANAPAATPSAPHRTSSYATAGAASIAKETAAHRASIDETGVGLYYGDHSPFKDMNAASRQAWIRANTIPGAEAPSPRESSCIGWAMQHVKAAYEGAGKSARWAQIARTVYQNGAKGTVLAKELERDGWTGVYFNPDTSDRSDGGEHSYTAALAGRGRPYYGLKVRDQITNYRAASANDTGLDKLKDTKFWFGLVRGGKHTFVGHGDTLSELHWSANPDDKDVIEEKKLKNFGWKSGIIMVPPGDWPQR